MQILGVEHALLLVARCLGMVQDGAAPLLAVDVARRPAQQQADVVLDGADGAARVNNLCLHVQVGCLHLVDSGAEGFAVLPEGLFRLQRLVPEAVGLQENLQLTVEHL